MRAVIDEMRWFVCVCLIVCLVWMSKNDRLSDWNTIYVCVSESAFLWVCLYVCVCVSGSLDMFEGFSLYLNVFEWVSVNVWVSENLCECDCVSFWDWAYWWMIMYVCVYRWVTYLCVSVGVNIFCWVCGCMSFFVRITTRGGRYFEKFLDHVHSVPFYV